MTILPQVKTSYSKDIIITPKHNYRNPDGSRPYFTFLRHDQRFSLKTETVTFGYVEHQIMSSNFSQTVTVNTHLVQ